MPYTAGEQEVRDFLPGCNIVPDGIVICLTHSGRPSGEAYVQLESQADVDLALKRDRERMDRRYVEVFGSSTSDLEAARSLLEVAQGVASKMREAVSEVRRGPESWRGVVRMRGLPFSARTDDIRNFFKDLSIRKDGIVLCEGRDGRPNGEAFVEFTKESHAEDALQFHRQVPPHPVVPRLNIRIKGINSFILRMAPENPPVAPTPYPSYPTDHATRLDFSPANSVDA
jgi:heterogeneous nuclear ribonucleoprotein F/H